MKEFFQIIILPVIVIINLSISFAYANTIDSSIRVWSFNMEGWHHQYPMQASYISFLKQKQIANDQNTPDFIATQENFGNTLTDFLPSFRAVKPSVTFTQYGRARKSGNSPLETNAIIYNSSRWALVPEAGVIENKLHAMADFCDAYTTTDSLTCQLTQQGSDGYARIITWGIFQEITNPNVFVIFTSSHHSLGGIDQSAEQQRMAHIVNKLIEQVQYFRGKGIIPLVVMAGDYNTPDNFKTLFDNLDTLTKDGKSIPWFSYKINPDSIFSNAANTSTVNYSPGDWITDHGPVAETIELDPVFLQHK